MARSLDLRRKTALVTGASSGIGRALAEVLARDVGTLVLVARRRDRLDSLAQALTAKHPALRVLVRDVDLGDRAATGKMIDALEDEGITVDVLINNAGFGDRGLLDERPWSKIEAMLELNVVTATFLIHRLLPGMIARGGGGIMNVGSVAGIVSKPGSAAYGASKSYLNSLSEVLHSELASTGVVVTGVLPGPIATEFTDMAMKADAAPVAESAAEHTDTARRDPLELPRLLFISPEECAEEAVRGLVRGKARVVTGAAVKAMAAVMDHTPRALLRVVAGRFARRMRT